jgi:O-antigen ligase
VLGLSLRVSTLFVSVELLAVGAYLISLQLGQPLLGMACLVAPFQILAWFTFSDDGFWLLLMLAALFPLATIEVLPRQYFVYVLYPGTLGILTVLRLARHVVQDDRGPRGLPAGLQWPLGVLALVVVLSAVHAVQRGWMSEFLVRHTVVALDVLWATWAFASVPRTVGQVRVTLFVVAGAAAVACVGLFLLPRPVGDAGLLGGKVIQAPFGIINYNAIATMAAAVAAAAVASASDLRRGLPRFLGACMIVVLLAALVITRSRGAWLGFGIAYAYILLRKRSTALVVVSALALTVLLSLDLVSRVVLDRVSETSVRDPSLLGRLLLWKYAIVVFLKSPVLGVGMENFRYVKHLFGYPFPMSHSVVYNAHNLYLELLVDLGVLGLIPFVWSVVGILRGLDRLVRTVGGPHRQIALALAAGITALATHGFWDALTWQHGAFMLIGVLLGLGVSMCRLGANGAAVASVSRGG